MATIAAIDVGTNAIRFVIAADTGENMRRIAEAMLAMELQFDLILSSPYARAFQTAEIVASTFNLKVTVSNTLIPDSNPADLIAEINDERPQRVLLVGHEPFLGELMSVLLFGNTKTAFELKKGGLSKLTADTLAFRQCAILNWLLTPKFLRQMR